MYVYIYIFYIYNVYIYIHTILVYMCVSSNLYQPSPTLPILGVPARSGVGNLPQQRKGVDISLHIDRFHAIHCMLYIKQKSNTLYIIML